VLTIGCENLMRANEALRSRAFVGALFKVAILSVLDITLSPPPLSCAMVT
jgi:hypothetical protein